MSSGAGRASRRVKGEQTNNNTQEPGSNNLPSPTTETNADYRAKPMTPTSSKEKKTQTNDPPTAAITGRLTVLSSVALGKTIWID